MLDATARFKTVAYRGQVLSYRMPAENYARLEALAARSAMTVDRWLDSTIACAMSNDEGHWLELDNREACARQVDRTRFAMLSKHHLANLPASTVEQLVEQLAVARVQGRQEGRRIAARVGLSMAGIVARLFTAAEEGAGYTEDGPCDHASMDRRLIDGRTYDVCEHCSAVRHVGGRGPLAVTWKPLARALDDARRARRARHAAREGASK